MCLPKTKAVWTVFLLWVGVPSLPIRRFVKLNREYHQVSSSLHSLLPQKRCNLKHGSFAIQIALSRLSENHSKGWIGCLFGFFSVKSPDDTKLRKTDLLCEISSILSFCGISFAGKKESRTCPSSRCWITSIISELTYALLPLFRSWIVPISLLDSI